MIQQRRQNTDYIRFRRAKLVMLLFLLVYIILLYRSNTTRIVDSQTLRDAMEQNESVAAMEFGDINTLKSQFSLDAAAYDAYLLYTSESFMDVDVLLIVQIKDETQLTELEHATDSYLEAQKTKFNGYGTDQMDLLDHAVIVEKGNYFFFCVSAEAEKWEEAFLSCIS